MSHGSPVARQDLINDMIRFSDDDEENHEALKILARKRNVKKTTAGQSVCNEGGSGGKGTEDEKGANRRGHLINERLEDS